MKWLLIIVSEPIKLLTISAGQTILTAAFVSIGLAHPIPDRLGRWLELPRQLLRRAASTDQIDHLLPELRRLYWAAPPIRSWASASSF